MTKSGNRQLSALIQLLICVPLILLLLFLASICFRWSVADIYATQVKFNLDKIYDMDVKQHVMVLNKTQRQIHQALEIRPENPEYLELADSLYQTVYSLEADSPTLKDELGWLDIQENAFKSARMALLSRPSWAYLWSELAISKIALRQFDAQFDGVLQRAMYLGPWQQSIYYQIAMNGLDNWETVSIESKQLIMEAIDQSMRINQAHAYRNKLKKMLEHNNLSKVCSQLGVLESGKLPLLRVSCGENNK